MRPNQKISFYLAFSVLAFGNPCHLFATTTWDGRYPTNRIEVTMVYFVPSDRTPLPDWRDRVDYFSKRIELFHTREFQGQSSLKTIVHPEPFISQSTTAELRAGDANAIYFQTLRETDRRLQFGKGQLENQLSQAGEKKPEVTDRPFPILLVLSDINWRPLDDFYRLRPAKENPLTASQDAEGSQPLNRNRERFAFEGVVHDGQHFPGAASGGSRAAYLAQRGIGWGLVSADGWRVPYRGTDCVIYHEGCGHTVGLPHPEPGDHSVMSGGQYHGWLSESWLDKDQKSKLGWQPEPDSDSLVASNSSLDFFSAFRVLPVPKVPEPNQDVTLALEWPEDAEVKSIRLRYQTTLTSPWVEVPTQWKGNAPTELRLARFDRPTPVSYRVDAELSDGSKSELWGYFQVRQQPEQPPLPLAGATDLQSSTATATFETNFASTLGPTQNLLATVDVDSDWQVGNWQRENNQLVSPKRYGARLQLAATPPAEYELNLIVEPLDQPNGLLLGCRSGSNRFAVLLHYQINDSIQSAIENVNGQNVGNSTTFLGELFQPNRLSQIIARVQKTGVEVLVDGQRVIHWEGPPDQLSLSDYWRTPKQDVLFIGCYDCRYRFHRISIRELK